MEAPNTGLADGFFIAAGRNFPPESIFETRCIGRIGKNSIFAGNTESKHPTDADMSSVIAVNRRT